MLSDFQHMGCVVSAPTYWVRDWLADCWMQAGQGIGPPRFSVRELAGEHDWDFRCDVRA